MLHKTRGPTGPYPLSSWLVHCESDLFTTSGFGNLGFFSHASEVMSWDINIIMSLSNCDCSLEIRGPAEQEGEQVRVGRISMCAGRSDWPSQREVAEAEHSSRGGSTPAEKFVSFPLQT